MVSLTSFSSLACTHRTRENVLKGKLWNRAIRCHKMVFESLWRILLDKYECWLQTSSTGENTNYMELSRITTKLKQTVSNRSTAEMFVKNAEALDVLKNLTSFTEFVDLWDETSQFWISYLNMVDILLTFIYSERVGNWDNRLDAFYRMLPWFSAYDHQNYARWGTVYHEFKVNIAFSIKSTRNAFNKLSVDQSLEHINKISKTAGDIIGITRNENRREEWSLTFNNIRNWINRCCNKRGNMHEEYKIGPKTSTNRLERRTLHSRTISSIPSIFQRNIFSVHNK